VFKHDNGPNANTDLLLYTAVTPYEEEQLVRERCEAFLGQNDATGTDRTEILGRQFDAGLAFVHFPEGCGGLGVSPRLGRLVNDLLGAAGVPRPAARTIIGHGMGAPTILAHGSDEQRRRHLRPLFTGEELWCQLFSEPSAGSDLSALATRAVREGDDWVVNGQKVWTSLGHLAKWGMLIARTDPDVPKHKGLTYFLVDMQSPGIQAVPLRQMTGESEFSEVYLSDVRVPDAQRLGDVGEGWKIALTTLMNERVALGSGKSGRGAGPIGEAVELWNAAPQRGTALRHDLTRLWIEAEVLRLTNLRAGQARRAGVPGPEHSVGKLATGELKQRIYALCLDIMGAETLLYGSYDNENPRADNDAGFVQRKFLRARANTIEGGTSEVQRNIIAERVLGLPAEPRDDKNRPWREVPRG